MDSSFSSSLDSLRFLSVEHQERHYSLVDKKIIEDMAFNQHPYEHPKIHNTLKKHKLRYPNRQIQLVAKDLVMEFLGQREPYLV